MKHHSVLLENTNSSLKGDWVFFWLLLSNCSCQLTLVDSLCVVNQNIAFFNEIVIIMEFIFDG